MDLDSTVEDEGVYERYVVGAACLQRCDVGELQPLVQARQEAGRAARCQVAVHCRPAHQHVAATCQEPAQEAMTFTALIRMIIT